MIAVRCRILSAAMLDAAIRNDVEGAVRRSRTKRAVTNLLADHTRLDQRIILAELLADRLADEFESVPQRSVSRSASGPRTHSTSESASGPKVRSGSAEPYIGGPSEYPAKALALLVSKPHMPIPEMARQIYGDASRENQHKMRSLLHMLKRTKRAHAVARGKWEVIQRSPA